MRIEDFTYDTVEDRVMFEPPVGDVADVPKDVINLMLHRQLEQGNPLNTEVFESNRRAGSSGGGFDWDETPEAELWDEMIDYDCDHAMDVLESIHPSFPMIRNENHGKNVVCVATDRDSGNIFSILDVVKKSGFTWPSGGEIIPAIDASNWTNSSTLSTVSSFRYSSKR